MKYTVFCKESNDTGTTWIDVIEVSDVQLQGLSPAGKTELIQNLARDECAMAWDWDSSDGISCYCVIPGDVEILYFEDLSE